MIEKGGVVKELLSGDEYKMCSVEVGGEVGDEEIREFFEEYADY